MPEPKQDVKKWAERRKKLQEEYEAQNKKDTEEGLRIFEFQLSEAAETYSILLSMKINPYKDGKLDELLKSMGVRSFSDVLREEASKPKGTGKNLIKINDEAKKILVAEGPMTDQELFEKIKKSKNVNPKWTIEQLRSSLEKNSETGKRKLFKKEGDKWIALGKE